MINLRLVQRPFKSHPLHVSQRNAALERSKSIATLLPYFAARNRTSGTVAIV